MGVEMKNWSFVCCVAVALLTGGCDFFSFIQKTDKAQARRVLKILQKCDIRSARDLSASNLALLNSACGKLHNRDLNKHYPRLVTYGGVLLGRLMPGDLPDLEKMSTLGVISACPVCRMDGRENCFTCRGSGVCARCKGTGSYANQVLDTFPGVRVGGDEVASSHHGSCSVECSFCGGTGHTAKPCRRCNGQKYLLSRKNLRHLYVEEYKVMEALLKSLSEQ